MNAKELIDKINQAIDGRYEVSFYYKPDADSDSKTNGLRFGQIHVYGQNHKGNDLIRVFQTAGATSRRKADKNPSVSPDRGYRTFKVANIRNMVVMDGADGAYKVFDKPVSGLLKTKQYTRQDGSTTTSTEREIFNPDGDELMVRIYNQVDFSQPTGEPLGASVDSKTSSAITGKSVEPTEPETQAVPVEPAVPTEPQAPVEPPEPIETEPEAPDQVDNEPVDAEDENLIVEPDEEEEELDNMNENSYSYLDFLRESFKLGKK